MALFDFLRDNWSIILGPLLGLVAIYTVLPRPKRGSALLGAAAGIVALLVGGLLIVRVGPVVGIEMSIEVALFYVFSAVAILAGGLLVTQRHPARAALSFAIVVLATCGLFLLQAGPFLLVSTIIVYAGAIIVTFLFVIMLAQQQGPSDADARSREPFLSSMTGFLLLLALLYVLKTSYKPDLDRWVDRSAGKLGDIQALIEKGNPSADAKKALVSDLRQFTQDYRRWLRNEWMKPPDPDAEKKPAPKNAPPGAKELERALDDAEGELPLQTEKIEAVDLAKVEAVFGLLHKAGVEVRNDPQLGNLKPNTQKLSELSGPSSNRYVAVPEELRKRNPKEFERESNEAIRSDKLGRPYLPAENTAYLGRSLFTDYLLPVELAGTLLLVATVGAIAIVTRQSTPRPPAASVNGPAPRRTA